MKYNYNSIIIYTLHIYNIIYTVERPHINTTRIHAKKLYII